MKKIVLALAVIGILTLVVWKGYQNDHNDIAEEYRYKVTDINAIGRIELLDHLGQEVVLARQKDYWILNDSSRVRSNAIDNLLDAISRIELQVIPGTQAINNLVKDLTTHGVRTRIFDRKGNLMKAYVIGGSTPDDRGNYIIMEGFDRPAVIHIPGWEGVLQTRFSMSEVEWKDRMVFRVRVDDILALKVDYPDHPQNSFMISSTNGNFTVLPINDNIVTGAPRKGAVEAYLRNYQSVGAEQILQMEPVLKAIQGQHPFVTIELQTSDQVQTVALYPIQITADASVRDRIERFYAITSNRDAFLVQQLVFKDLFWGIESFFED